MEPYTCDFCGKKLKDPMLGFMAHLDEDPDCKWLWQEWRKNVRREAGGT